MYQSDFEKLMGQLSAAKKRILSLQEESKLLQTDCEKMEELLRSMQTNSISEKDKGEAVSDARNASGETVEQRSTICELFLSNQGASPLIVHKDSWTRDYCYVIHGIKDGEASGNSYNRGELAKIGWTKPDNERRYTLYGGKYLDKVIQNECRLTEEQQTATETNKEIEPIIVRTCSNCAFSNGDSCPYGQMHDPKICDEWRYNNLRERREREGWPDHGDATTIREGGHPGS